MMQFYASRSKFSVWDTLYRCGYVDKYGVLSRAIRIIHRSDKVLSPRRVSALLIIPGDLTSHISQNLCMSSGCVIWRGNIDWGHWAESQYINAASGKITLRRRKML